MEMETLSVLGCHKLEQTLKLDEAGNKSWSVCDRDEDLISWMSDTSEAIGAQSFAVELNKDGRGSIPECGEDGPSGVVSWTLEVSACNKIRVFMMVVLLVLIRSVGVDVSAIGDMGCSWNHCWCIVDTVCIGWWLAPRGSYEGPACKDISGQIVDKSEL
jgi:hypothetical protein